MIKKFLFLLFLFTSSFNINAASGSWNGVAFTAWNGVAQTAWNGTGVSCAGGGGGGISSPLDIANCIRWLDASDSSQLFTDNFSTLVGSDGDLVYGWNDKSTGNHDVSQSTSGNRPTYKTNIKNSKSVLRFDGSNDQYPDTLGTMTTRSIFIVARSTSTTTGYKTLLTEGGNRGLYFRVTAGDGTFVCDAYSSGDHDSGTSVVNSWVIFSITVRSDGTATAYKNGSSFFSGTSSSSIAFDSIGGHGSEYLTGDYAEQVIFDRELTGTEVGQMHTYLNNKWAIY